MLGEKCSVCLSPVLVSSRPKHVALCSPALCWVAPQTGKAGDSLLVPGPQHHCASPHLAGRLKAWGQESYKNFGTQLNAQPIPN